MTNYAMFSEVIAKKVNEAETALESIELVIYEITQPTVNDLEKRYIKGEDVGEALDEAYEAHEKACNEHEKREHIYKELKEAQEHYKEVMKHIEYANYAKCNW